MTAIELLLAASIAVPVIGASSMYAVMPKHEVVDWKTS